MALIDDIKAKVKDSSGKLTDPDDFNRAIAESLNRYSSHRPKNVSAVIQGTGKSDYGYPAGWVPGFSVITDIEYPTGNVPALLLKPDDWTIYVSPVGEVIRILSETPGAAETFIVFFTVIRQEVDIIAQEYEAVVNLAAGLCCEMLASSYAQTSDPTMLADSVNYRTKSDEFTRRAKAFYALYDNIMGVDKENPANSATRNYDKNYPWGGDRITHPRRWR